MARRSPMNERYSKNTAPSGKTRKSAAAAKPKRAKSEKPVSSSSGSGSSRDQRSAWAYTPPTPEFKRWRRIWWALLIGSLLFTAGSWGARSWTGSDQLAAVLIGIGYVGIFGAFGIDMFVLRRLRREYALTGATDSAAKAAKSESKGGADAEDSSAGDTPANDES